MSLHYVVAVLVAATVVLALQSPPPGDPNRITPGWPCPIQGQIAPCICFQDTEYNLHMDCSLANSEEQLENIFSAVFPFPDFYELQINHNHNDVNNVIDEITANTFANLNFERIIITGTRLKEIKDEAFADSHNTLKHLDLSNNFLVAYPFESLSVYLQLETFILDDNNIPFLFDLESVTLKVFSVNRNPNMVMNSRTQFTGVPRLTELYASEIGLQILKTGMFNTLYHLKVIDFSKNHLKVLEEDSITAPEHTLTKVNFNTNAINFIRHGAIVGLKENATLTMAANNLTKIEEEHWSHIFKQITWRETIDLRGNRLLCGCDIDWLFMNYEEEYLCRLTDTTLCSSSQQVIFLDVHIYCDQCADSILECPPQTDCKNPVGPLLY